MTLDKSTRSLFEKVEMVETYLHSNKPLRDVAREMNIPFQTLWYWTKQYKEKGKKAFLAGTNRKKFSHDVEHRIMFLKEQNPSVTIRDAQHLLKKHGVNVSYAGIWHIWKRYGLIQRPLDDPLNPFGAQTPEVTTAATQAKILVKRGDLRAAVRLLNALPSLPADPIIKKIPYRLLSPRKRLERLYYELSSVSFSEQRQKAHRIGSLLERKGYVFSSILADLLELNALGWMGKPELRKSLLKRLGKKMVHVKDRVLWFHFYCAHAKTYCSLSQISRALDIVKKCRKLMYSLSSPHYIAEFGDLLTFVGRFCEATIFYQKALERVDDPMTSATLSMKIANFGPCFSGDYRLCQRWLTRAQAIKRARGIGAFYYNVRAQIAFGRGDLAQARTLYLESLQKSSKAQINNFIFITTTGLAAVAMALAQEKEARVHLKKYLPLMKKHSMTREAIILRQLLGTEDAIPEDLLYIHGFRLISLLAHARRSQKAKDYRKAFRFAQQEGMLGIFQRWIVFFPNVVLDIIEKGKKTGLPKALLKFPLFNQSMPVHHVKFLGDVAVQRNQKSLRTRLSPQETAFLIHLAMRAGSPRTSVTTAALCQNFWPKSSQPGERLQHLLTRIKKKLTVPGHMLTVSSRYGESRLYNRGLYLTTDYSELEILFTQIKSLERAGEWQFAKRDYLRAFALLRGAPFNRMYDTWSDSLREVILNKVENEALNFTKGCMAHNNEKEARRVLKKILEIIPQSDKLRILTKET